MIGRVNAILEKKQLQKLDLGEFKQNLDQMFGWLSERTGEAQTNLQTASTYLKGISSTGWRRRD
jgi:hypothetical protein